MPAWPYPAIFAASSADSSFGARDASTSMPSCREEYAVDVLIPLSADNCAIRVPSRNRRNTSTACSSVLNARRLLRVPRRARSASSGPVSNTTVRSRAGRVAVYVTLIKRRAPMKLIFGRTNIHTGALRLFLAPHHHRRVTHTHYTTSPTVTRNGSMSQPMPVSLPKPFSFRAMMSELFGREPSPSVDFEPPVIASLTKPLTEAKVGMFVSCGVFPRTDQTPLQSTNGLSYRLVSRETPLADLELAHRAAIRAFAVQDLNVAYPRDRMLELEQEGVFRELAANAVSLVGAISRQEEFLREVVPQIHNEFASQEVDLVLLLPFCPACHLTGTAGGSRTRKTRSAHSDDELLVGTRSRVQGATDRVPGFSDGVPGR
jgi:hypothetical protein